MKFTKCTTAICAVAIIATQAKATDGWTVAQERVFRENAPEFHKNFSTGDFDKNGPLVTEDIDVDSNNVKLVGREKFVQRIERYSIPFPGLQLKDRVIIVDGNVAAVNYILQGEHKGPYGKLPPTGNKIEAMSGEVFEFSPQGLMKKLTTITELDRVESEIKGDIKIGVFQKISLQPIEKVDSKTRAIIHAAAAQFHENFNAGKNENNAALAVEDVHINADSQMLQGKRALLDRLQRLKTPFPDLTIHDEYVLTDGERAAVEYTMEGTHTGPLQLPDGSTLPPSGKKVRVRAIDFMDLDKAGLLKEVTVIHNENDFRTQLTQ